MASVARRLVQVGVEEEWWPARRLWASPAERGSAAASPALIIEEIDKLKLYDEPEKNVVFVDDGLARGAAVMARCMNSMGTP